MSEGLRHLVEDYEGDCFLSVAICPICSGKSRVAHSAFNIHPEKPCQFSFRECLVCNHGWIDPMPTQPLLNHLYSSGSLSVIGADWSQMDAQPLSVPGKFVVARELNGGSRTSTFFELGVGKGALYKQFVARGWNCNGVDPGSWGQKFPGVFPDIESLPSDIHCDVIVALDVLEHVADPISMLQHLRRLASPAARLYAAMPNKESFRAKWNKEHWRMLRPLGHLNYWSRDSIRRTFDKAGFSVNELRKTDMWEPQAIRSLRSVAAAAIEHLRLGDQWIVVAQTK